MNLRWSTVLSVFTLVTVKLIGSGGSVQNESSPSSPNSPSSPPIDLEGYVLFCLCMGRLGNQMEHFLGGLEFAKQLNRTLVLPPFTYSHALRKVNWNEWFQVKPLREYHRVILADTFVKYVAPKIWPVGRRVGFCWQNPNERKSEGQVRCDMKRGDTARSFWDSLKVDFDSYEGLLLSYEAHDSWRRQYSAEAFPVIALPGAPAPYPMRRRNWPLQKYVRFSEDIKTQTDKFVKGFIGEGKKFVGIHLRNGEDWEIVCRDFKDDPDGERATARHYMASPQCYGDNHEQISSPFAHRACIQSKSIVVETVKRAVDFIGAQLVFIATDRSPFREDLETELKSRKVRVVFLDPDVPLYDLDILSRSHLFIGNCFSSFSSFVRRLRDVDGKPTWYFGID